MPRGRDRARARGPPALIAAGRERGEIILQTPASFGESDEEALESSRERKGTLVDEAHSEDLHDPAAIAAAGGDLSDTTPVVVMNVSGADPHGLIRGYGERVLSGPRD